MAVQVWSAEDYAREGRFVADLAASLVELLAPLPGERILDLGCGDGVLTRRIAEAGAAVTGADSSPAMVDAARESGLDARLIGAEALPFEGEFDAVFSNAALHWVRDQDAMLAGVFRALKPGGRFVAEMGGHGNIAALRVALRAAIDEAGAGVLLAGEHAENYFPTADAYAARLAAHGFTVESMALRPRPTPLGANGVRGWYETFRTGVLGSLSAEVRASILDRTEQLLEPALRAEDGTWVADYVRLRFVARKP